jgi:hypothetical protein
MIARACHRPSQCPRASAVLVFCKPYVASGSHDMLTHELVVHSPSSLLVCSKTTYPIEMAGTVFMRLGTCPKRLVIEARWGSKPLAFAGKLQPRRLIK